VLRAAYITAQYRPEVVCTAAATGVGREAGASSGADVLESSCGRGGACGTRRLGEAILSFWRSTEGFDNESEENTWDDGVRSGGSALSCGGALLRARNVGGTKAFLTGGTKGISKYRK